MSSGRGCHAQVASECLLQYERRRRKHRHAHATRQTTCYVTSCIQYSHILERRHLSVCFSTLVFGFAPQRCDLELSLAALQYPCTFCAGSSKNIETIRSGKLLSAVVHRILETRASEFTTHVVQLMLSCRCPCFYFTGHDNAAVMKCIQDTCHRCVQYWLHPMQWNS